MANFARGLALGVESGARFNRSMIEAQEEARKRKEWEDEQKLEAIDASNLAKIGTEQLDPASRAGLQYGPVPEDQYNALPMQKTPYGVMDYAGDVRREAGQAGIGGKKVREMLAGQIQLSNLERQERTQAKSAQAFDLYRKAMSGDEGAQQQLFSMAQPVFNSNTIPGFDKGDKFELKNGVVEYTDASGRKLGMPFGAAIESMAKSGVNPFEKAFEAVLSGIDTDSYTKMQGLQTSRRKEDRELQQLEATKAHYERMDENTKRHYDNEAKRIGMASGLQAFQLQKLKEADTDMREARQLSLGLPTMYQALSEAKTPEDRRRIEGAIQGVQARLEVLNPKVGFSSGGLGRSAVEPEQQKDYRKALLELGPKPTDAKSAKAWESQRNHIDSVFGIQRRDPVMEALQASFKDQPQAAPQQQQERSGLSIMPSIKTDERGQRYIQWPSMPRRGSYGFDPDGMTDNAW